MIVDGTFACFNLKLWQLDKWQQRKDWLVVCYKRLCSVEGVEATEELFKISADPLELNNLVLSKEAPKDLKRLQKVYDSRVRKWGAQAVNFNDYAPYKKVFDRDVPWTPNFAPGEPAWK